MYTVRNALRSTLRAQHQRLGVVACICACLLMVWVTVFHHTRPFSVSIGGDAETVRRGLDEPFINGFWPPEPDNWDPTTTPAYRWSTPQWRIQWPFVGRGYFVSSSHIDASAWGAQQGVALTWVEPALTNVALLRGRRIVSVLVSGNGLRAGISVISARLPVTDDRRELGVMLSKSTLRPLTGTWRPVQLVIGALVLVVLSAVFATWRTRGHYWYSAGVVLLYSVAWLADPLWWHVHSRAIADSVLLAAVFAFILVCVIMPESRDRTRWWWLTTVSICVPLIALRSPFLYTSDGAMHARMLFDVMRGNLFQIAELPCEAGAFTVPYPPFVYIMAAPFAVNTWNRDAAIALLMTGAVVTHVGALLYLFRVERNDTGFNWTAGVFLLMASWSMPFLQSVHIGELSNAWGLAVLLIAVVSWYDERASLAQRSLFGAAALLAHTGIALSFGLTLLIILGYTAVRTRRLPRPMLFAAGSMVLIAAMLTYSAYSGLVGQSATYPGCPPDISLVTKFSVIPSALPSVVLCLAIIGLIGNVRARSVDIVIPALVVAVLSIGVLVFRDQTVRWSMVVYPFLLLIAMRALSMLSVRGTAGKIYAITLGIGVPTIVIVRFWERVYTYLHM